MTDDKKKIWTKFHTATRKCSDDVTIIFRNDNGNNSLLSNHTLHIHSLIHSNNS